MSATKSLIIFHRLNKIAEPSDLDFDGNYSAIQIKSQSGK